MFSPRSVTRAVAAESNRSRPCVARSITGAAGRGVLLEATGFLAAAEVLLLDGVWGLACLPLTADADRAERHIAEASAAVVRVVRFNNSIPFSLVPVGPVSPQPAVPDALSDGIGSACRNTGRESRRGDAAVY